MELAFASLHQLCAPLLDQLEVLPGPQHDALEIAFGLRAGTAPDRFLIGLAVLTLLAEVAEERPLLCVIDDAQWLDRASAQVLAFAARRLLAEPVGLIFAAREPGEQFRGLADLEVRGLADQEARALLRSAARFRLDERVQDRILPRRTATRWRCWSCRTDWTRPSWPAGSGWSGRAQPRRCCGGPRPPSPAPTYPCKKACSGAGWSGWRTGRCGMRRADG